MTVAGTTHNTTYMRAYNLNRYHERMGALRQILGGKCVVCGSTDDLEIDHIDRRLKSFTISAKWDSPMDVLLEELKKCQLLCSTHHAEKSAREMSVGHGEGKSGKRNCKCAPCKARKAEYMAAYALANPRQRSRAA